MSAAFLKIGQLFLNPRAIASVYVRDDGDVWVTTTAVAYDGGTRADQHLLSGEDAAALVAWLDVYAGACDVQAWYELYQQDRRTAQRQHALRDGSPEAAMPDRGITREAEMAAFMGEEDE